MSEATGDRPSNPKGPGEPGSWMDEWGACKVCGGEIPEGHTADCDVFKMEMELRAYQECEKLAAPLSCPTHGLVPNLAWFNNKCPNCKVEQLTRERDLWQARAMAMFYGDDPDKATFGDIRKAADAYNAWLSDRSHSPSETNYAHIAETMDIRSPVGSRIVFANPRAGWPADVANANRWLVEGQTYTISRIDICSSITRVWLKELPDYGPFNSAQFRNEPSEKADGDA